MIDPRDVYALTDFQRNAKTHIRRLKKTGRPEVLTVNGKAAVIVQDAAAFTAMLRRLEEAWTTEAVRRGMEEADGGQTVSLNEVTRQLRSAPRVVKRRSA
jgi:PHD/YefM family antitoxin component YafN of YafNO toxin-antitoxin module